jgi:asparagine synthetase B (glutamine-hydrolysing)
VTGILGLLDPAGVDPDELRAAAAAAAYRGSVDIRSFGPVLLGTYTRDTHQSRLVERQSSVLVADARVDAPLPGSVGERLWPGSSGDELLATLLDEVGPGALDGLAADFALARWDPGAGRLLLTRDAFGLRPLYWAQKGSRVAFAPDPSVLVALGVVDGDLEFDVVAHAVLGGDPAGEATAFVGVQRVIGGTWVAFDLRGSVAKDRWFRPDRVSVETMSLAEASSRVREALVGAVATRAEGERVAIALSGGRDSGAVAAAARNAGVSAVCLTMELTPDTVPSEVDEAQQLAAALDHMWRPVPIDANVRLEDLLAVPDLAGSPIGFPSFPVTTAVRDAAVAAGTSVFLDGEGGDPLFAATPVAVVDLARSGSLKTAWRAAKAFRTNWRYTYPVIAKIAGRAVAPKHLLELRERSRPHPPWAVGSRFANSFVHSTSAHGATVTFLSSLGASHYLELLEQVYQRVGIRYACPFYDQRVVRTALALPVELRVPLPRAKPVLSRAFLGDLASTRVKARHTPYFAALAETMHAGFPWLFESGSLCARRGYVAGSIGPLSAGERWLVESLNVVPTEMWVRRTEDGHGE